MCMQRSDILYLLGGFEITCMIRYDVAPYTMAAQRESVSCVVERVSCNECCWRFADKSLQLEGQEQKLRRTSQQQHMSYRMTLT